MVVFLATSFDIFGFKGERHWIFLESLNRWYFCRVSGGLQLDVFGEPQALVFLPSLKGVQLECFGPQNTLSGSAHRSVRPAYFRPSRMYATKFCKRASGPFGVVSGFILFEFHVVARGMLK